MHKTLKNILGMNEKNNQEFGSALDAHQAVFCEPPQVKPGDKVNISYQGLLKNSGAQTVYLHYGFDSWRSPETLMMRKVENGVFQAEIPAKGNNEINFCFKDSAGNWDNNSGYNWNLHLQ